MIRFFLLFVILYGNAHAAVDVYLAPDDFTIYMYEYDTIYYNISGEFDANDAYYITVTSQDPHIIEVNERISFSGDESGTEGNFSVYASFIGRTTITVTVTQESTASILATTSASVRAIRKHRVIDTVFTVSVALLVSLMYINFGCALNWGDMILYLKKPVGPVIGFVGQFILMPLISYGVGWALFPDEPTMQLGFFFVGCSPGGGGSNIWTAILDGNIDLSICMTGVSTLAAFGMIPLWMFTLGAVIFDRSSLEVPYANISMFAAGLIIPLAIGYLVQRYLKRIAEFLKRTLKICSGFLIIFIIVFAIATNLYLFEIFSWRIVISGMGVPWLGYLGGFLLAKIFRQNNIDALTIGIETGIQNTGIAIFLLRFSLPQPEADLTTIAPVSAACMTPIPPLILFLVLLVRKKIQQRKIKPSPESFGDKLKEERDKKQISTAS